MKMDISIFSRGLIYDLSYVCPMKMEDNN